MNLKRAIGNDNTWNFSPIKPKKSRRYSFSKTEDHSVTYINIYFTFIKFKKKNKKQKEKKKKKKKNR